MAKSYDGHHQRYQEPGSEKTIDIHDKALFLSPTKVKLDDLIIFSSTKKTETETREETESDKSS